MMDLFQLLLLAVLLRPSIPEDINPGRKPRFLVSAPSLVRAGESFRVFVTVYDINEVNMTLRLEDGRSNTLATVWTVVDQGMPSHVTLEVGNYWSILPDRYRRRYVLLLVSTPSSVLNMHSRKVPILVSPESGHLFIQTNKPLYTPHDKEVKTRIYSVDKDMHALDRPIQVELIDPAGSVVAREPVRPNSGIAQAVFNLPEFPEVGLWTVRAQSGPHKELTMRRTFLLQAEALEPFSIDVTSDKYIYSSMESLRIVVTPRSLDGLMVTGRVWAEFHVVRGQEATPIGGMRSSNTTDDTSAVFDLSLADVGALGDSFRFPDLAEARLSAQVYVLEKASGREVKVTKDISRFVLSPFVINLNHSAKYFRRGRSMTYDLKVDVKYRNGTPSADLLVTIKKGSQITQEKTDARGQIVKQYDVNSSDQELIFLVTTNATSLTSQNQISGLLRVLPADSPGGATLNLNLDSHEVLKVGQTVEFSVHFSNIGRAYNVLNLLVISKGHLVKFMTSTLDTGGIRSMSLRMSRDMVPTVRLVAFLVFTDGTVVADSEVLRVVGRCSEVHLSLEKTSVTPNEGNKLLASGPSGSHLAFVWMDQRLHKPEYVLQQRHLEAAMEAADTGCGPGGDRTANEIFQNAGLVTVSNTHLSPGKREWTDCRRSPPPRHSRFRRSTDFPEPQLKRYIDFRLSGAWETKTIEGEGLTFWVPATAAVSTRLVQVVSMSGRDGLCVGPPLSYKVQLSYSELQLNLPYELVVGQQAEVSATVFFRKGAQCQLTAVLKGSRDICSGIEQGEWSSAQLAVVRPPEGVTFSWPVVPLKSGETDVEVMVTSQFERLVVKKQLNVVVGGVSQTVERTFILEPGYSTLGTASVVGQQETVPLEGVTVSQNVRNRELQTVVFKVFTPNNMIKDSLYYEIAIMGELLAPAVSTVLSDGLTQLLTRKPIGCGEQSMMRIGPIVFALKYLEKTKQMNGSLERETYANIEKGIKYMEKFRNDNGSFSVWPGKPPSVWLTAYVTTILSQATDYSDTLRANHMAYVCRSALWLVQHQRPDGAFAMDRLGVLLDQRVTGGVDGVVAMTAYVLIGLSEARCQGTEAAAERAQIFLTGQLRGVREVYPMAISAYALSLCPHLQDTLKHSTLDRLMSRASFNKVSQEMWWSVDMAKFSHRKRVSMLEHPALAVEIETAAYALLTLMKLTRMEQAGHVAAWLIARHKSNGHFVSTQDTVIGLQALARYRALTYREDLDMTIKITSNSKVVVHSFKLTSDNKDIRHTFEITREVTMKETFVVEARGTGVARMSVLGHHNTPHTDDHCVLGLAARALHKYRGGNESCGSDMGVDDTCVNIRYGRVDFNGTRHMAIIKVGVPAGVTPIDASLRALVASNLLVSAYEITSGSVVFYLDRLPANRRESLNFLFNRTAGQVADSKPVGVTAYDFYSPGELSCQTFYYPDVALDFRSPNIRVFTRSDGSLQCIESSPPRCYGADETLEVPWSVMDLKTHLCLSRNMVHYAYVVKFVSRRYKDGALDDEEWEAVVTRVLKSDPALTAGKGTTLYFYASAQWQCKPRVVRPEDRGPRYFIAGYVSSGQHEDSTNKYHMTSSTYTQAMNKMERSVKRFIKNFRCTT